MDRSTKWRNAAKQWLETMNLYTYTKENSFPLYSPFTLYFTPKRCLSVGVGFQLLFTAGCWAIVLRSILPLPPTNHHHWALGLTFLLDYWSSWSIDFLLFTLYTFLLNWARPTSPGTCLLFIDFWIRLNYVFGLFALSNWLIRLLLCRLKVDALFFSISSMIIEIFPYYSDKGIIIKTIIIT